MALFPVYVLQWQADSWKRVRDADNGTLYLLNTNRLDSIMTHTTNPLLSTLYYYDNPFDKRDSGNYMVLDMSVSDIITYMNTSLAHGSVTLNVYLNNDPTATTEEVEISCANFAFAVEDVNSSSRSWVTYTLAGWDTKTVLVNNTIANILTQAMG